VFVKLMRDLQLAHWALEDAIEEHEKHEATRFERPVWKFVTQYLTTLESTVY
jgi:hypothetical protein